MKSRSFFILALFLLSFSPVTFGQNGSSVNPKAAGMSMEGLQRFENFLNAEIEAKRVAGAVGLISRKGETAYSKALGYNRIADQDAMTMDKIFYIQSMTKPIISIAFMTLYEEGHFFLTDPVSNYLPEFADMRVIDVQYNKEGEAPTINYVAPKSPVLIWHLLSHTAGFSHGLGQNDYDQKLTKLLYETPHKTIRDRVDALTSYPLMGHPGEQWNYSASPDVLALLIEHFSGQTVDEFLKERIFDPLGMDDTGYNVHTDKMDRVVGLHQMNGEGVLESIDQWSPLQGNTVFGGTHGLFSTASDYMKFGLMLLNGGEYNGKRILGRKTIELMTENHIEGLPYANGNGFGLGFGIRTDVSDSKISGSPGAFYWGGMFNTYFFVDQEEDLVAVLMTQSFPYTDHYSSKLRQFVYSAIAD